MNDEVIEKQRNMMRQIEILKNQIQRAEHQGNLDNRIRMLREYLSLQREMARLAQEEVQTE